MRKYRDSHFKAKMSDAYDVFALIKGGTDKRTLPNLNVWTGKGDVHMHFTSPHPYRQSDQKVRDLVIWAVDKVWRFNNDLLGLEESPLAEDDETIAVTIDIAKMMDFGGMYGSNRKKHREAFTESIKRLGHLTVNVYLDRKEKIGRNEVSSMTMWFFTSLKVLGEYEQMELHIHKRYAQLLLSGELVNVGAYITHERKSFDLMRFMNLNKVRGERRNGLPMYHDQIPLDEISREVYGDPELLLTNYNTRNTLNRMLEKLNKTGDLPPYRIDLKNKRIIVDKTVLGEQVKEARIKAKKKSELGEKKEGKTL